MRESLSLRGEEERVNVEETEKECSQRRYGRMESATKREAGLCLCKCVCVNKKVRERECVCVCVCVCVHLSQMKKKKK